MALAQRQFTIHFLTPAFLGNAHQDAAWRTPPFKSELRRWWRAAMAARGWEVAAIRDVEGTLFGEAADGQSRRSRVRLRFERWQSYPGQAWEAAAERSRLRATGQQLDAAGYLGYGRVAPPGAKNSAIPPKRAQGVTWRLAWPTDRFGDGVMEEVLGLMDRFGTVGGRSRNGWGSYVLEPADTGAALPSPRLADYRVDWREAVTHHPWARGLGWDTHGPLLWQTQGQARWEDALRELGVIRKALCQAADNQRCLLSYPVTDRRQPRWGPSDRVPNTLRFKIRSAGRDETGYVGQIAHFPCRPADRLWQELTAADQRRFPALWERLHDTLDHWTTLERVSA